MCGPFLDEQDNQEHEDVVNRILDQRHAGSTSYGSVSEFAAYEEASITVPGDSAWQPADRNQDALERARAGEFDTRTSRYLRQSRAVPDRAMALLGL